MSDNIINEIAQILSHGLGLKIDRKQKYYWWYIRNGERLKYLPFEEWYDLMPGLGIEKTNDIIYDLNDLNDDDQIKWIVWNGWNYHILLMFIYLKKR